MELEHAGATQRRFVWLASASYSAWRGLLEQNPDALDLMVGTPRMGEILRHIGWQATARGSLRLIAAAAPQPCEMTRGGDGRRSTNLSYVVDQNWRGRGLGRLVVSAAFARLAEAQIQDYGVRAAPALQPHAIIHAQVRSDNPAGSALAASLGLLREQRAGFTVPHTERAVRAGAAGLEFAAWTGNAVRFLERCRSPLDVCDFIEGPIPESPQDAGLTGTERLRA
jgi:GNAT superfamily N-acetyltransferase